MDAIMHAAAPEHLPPFITAPNETDLLFVFIVCFLLGLILLVGNFYFKIHALPERMAHSANSTQLQLVGVLALLALFTHNNVFWVAALLLAALRFPDVTSPLNGIARSLEDIVRRIGPRPGSDASGLPAADPGERPAVTRGGTATDRSDA